MVRNVTDNSHETLVKEYFDKHAEDWHAVYLAKDFLSLEMQQRLRYVCNYIDTIGLKRGARVLDLGCGAGFTSLQLLQRGCIVTGIDISEKMLDVARKNCSHFGPERNITFHLGNAEQLYLQDASFDAVIALGLLEYTERDGRALHEMTRILKLGGYLILSVPNRFSFSSINIPFNCIFNSKQLALWIKKSGFKGGFPYRLNQVYRPSRIRCMLSGFGFDILDSVSYGFGPFVLLRKSEKMSIYLNQILTTYSKKKIPILSECGNEHLFFCRKRSASLT
jgi:ubiquinone/menaquinone biosynthesis C-methylase UbiE